MFMKLAEHSILSLFSEHCVKMIFTSRPYSVSSLYILAVITTTAKRQKLYIMSLLLIYISAAIEEQCMGTFNYDMIMLTSIELCT